MWCFTDDPAVLINCKFLGEPGLICYFANALQNLCLWWRHLSLAQASHQADIIIHISRFWTLVSLQWYTIGSDWILQFALLSQCHLSQSVQSLLFCEIPWSWNCCGEQCVLCKLWFPLHHQSLAEIYLCKFYEGNSTFSEDWNKLFNRSFNLQHSSDSIDLDRMDDTLI